MTVWPAVFALMGLVALGFAFNGLRRGLLPLRVRHTLVMIDVREEPFGFALIWVLYVLSGAFFVYMGVDGFEHPAAS